MSSSIFHVFMLLPFLGLGACRHADSAGAETAPIGPAAISQATLDQGLVGQVSFATHIKPILEAHCVACHNSSVLPGRFTLTSRETAFQSGGQGPRIVPGKPDQSLLFLNPHGTHATTVNSMPPVGNRFTAGELKLLRRWIEQGATWPAGVAGKLRPPS